MRRKLSGILFGLLFLVGFGIPCLPHGIQSVEYVPAEQADQ